GCQCDSVQPDPHGKATVTPQLYAGNTVHHGKLVYQEAVGVIVQLQEGHLGAGQAVVLDGARIAVRLGNLRRIDFIRQSTRHPGNLVADIVGRLVDVPAHRELHRNVGAAIAAAGVDRGDTLDAVDLVLDELGDLGFDDLCGG